MTRMVELSDYCRDLLTALAAESVDVLQLHPEYAAGQFELSAAPLEPVAAADQVLLVRETVRAVSRRHGMDASFAPAVVAGLVGNGQHLHLSLRHGGVNLLDGGYGRYGMTGEGESFLAGVLEAMPALTAILAPSVASHVRLVPSRWAGAYQCWGRENREAALRLVTGSTGETDVASNAEVKCLDASANPYLVVGAVLTVGVAALDKGLTLPEEVSGDPATMAPVDLERSAWSGCRRPPRRPSISSTKSDLLKKAMGEYLYDAFTAVRRAEVALFADATPDAGRRGDPLALLGRRRMGIADELADLPLVDQHCHPVVLDPLNRAGFELLLTEAHERGPEGTSEFDSQVGLAVRRWCAPVLGLERARGAGRLPGPAHRARAAGGRAAAAGGLRHQRPARRHRPAAPRPLRPGRAGRASGARVHEVTRVESVVEEVAASGVEAAGLGGAVVEALAERAGGSVGFKTVAAYRVGLELPADPPTDTDVRRAADRWLAECERTGRCRLDDADAGRARRPRLPAAGPAVAGAHRLRRPRPHPAPRGPVAADAVPPRAAAWRWAGRAAALLPLPPAGRLPGQRVPAGHGRRQPRGQPRRPARSRRARRDTRARAVRFAALRLRRVRPAPSCTTSARCCSAGRSGACSTTGWPTTR